MGQQRPLMSLAVDRLLSAISSRSYLPIRLSNGLTDYSIYVGISAGRNIIDCGLKNRAHCRIVFGKRTNVVFGVIVRLERQHAVVVRYFNCHPCIQQ